MAVYVNKPTPQDFLYALGSHWFTLVSSGLSVPFTIVSIYSSGSTRVIFACLAAAGVFVASYRLWAHEREERVKVQEELEETKAKLGRPQIKILLQHDQERNGQRLWVCLMNYTDSPAVNVSADDIACGSHILRLDAPSDVTQGYSPNIQMYWPEGGSLREDIAYVCGFNRDRGGADRSNSMLIAIRYTDVDGKHEWATFGKFFYDFGERKFKLEKMWIEKTKTNQRKILTV